MYVCMYVLYVCKHYALTYPIVSIEGGRVAEEHLQPGLGTEIGRAAGKPEQFRLFARALLPSLVGVELLPSKHLRMYAFHW